MYEIFKVGMGVGVGGGVYINLYQSQSLTATMFLRNIFIIMTPSSDIMWNLFARMISYCDTNRNSFTLNLQKKILINRRNFLQVLFLVETPSQNSKRCLFFMGNFS